MVAQMVKNLPTVQESQVLSLGKGMATHSSILAWRIPWTGAWQATVCGITKSQTKELAIQPQGAPLAKSLQR